MDDRLQKALEFANYRQTLNNQLHKLKIKADGQLIYAEAGGKFTIDRALISFVDIMVRSNKLAVVLLDDNNNPVQISDTTAFLKNIITRYHEVMDDYFKESQIIKKSRNVKSIVGEQ